MVFAGHDASSHPVAQNARPIHPYETLTISETLLDGRGFHLTFDLREIDPLLEHVFSLIAPSRPAQQTACDVLFGVPSDAGGHAIAAGVVCRRA